MMAHCTAMNEVYHIHGLTECLYWGEKGGVTVYVKNVVISHKNATSIPIFFQNGRLYSTQEYRVLFASFHSILFCFLWRPSFQIIADVVCQKTWSQTRSLVFYILRFCGKRSYVCNFACIFRLLPQSPLFSRLVILSLSRFWTFLPRKLALNSHY